MKRGRSLFFKILLHVFLPLLIGLFIYVFYRSNVWINRFLNWTFNEQLDTENYPVITRWMIYSGPDFCWAYSFASAIFILNHLYKFSSHRFVFIIVLLLTGASEIIQFFFTSHFTFSFPDLIFILLACILSAILNKRI